jgi:uncharacterized protein
VAVDPLVDETPHEVPVRGILHRATESPDALVLTHGASGNCNAPLLVALAQRFAASGVTVLRCDLPFRQLRPPARHPPPAPNTTKKDCIEP